MRPPSLAGEGWDRVFPACRGGGIGLTSAGEQNLELPIACDLAQRGWRVLETSHPPTWYIPPEDVKLEHLRENEDTIVGMVRARVISPAASTAPAPV